MNVEQEFFKKIFSEHIHVIIEKEVSDFPICFFSNDDGINCAYHIEKENISNSVRNWLNDNVEDDCFILIRNMNVWLGMNIFFTSGTDAIKFITMYGHIAEKL